MTEQEQIKRQIYSLLIIGLLIFIVSMIIITGKVSELIYLMTNYKEYEIRRTIKN